MSPYAKTRGSCSVCIPLKANIFANCYWTLAARCMYRQNRGFLADCAQLFFSEQPIISDPQWSRSASWLLRVRLGIPALFRLFERCIDRNQVLLGTMNKTCRRIRLFEQLLLTGSVVFFRLSDIVVQREVRLGEARSRRIPTWARVPRSPFLELPVKPSTLQRSCHS